MEVARKALKWLICCQQPLTLGELGTAIAILPGTQFDEEEKLDSEELILEILGSLIRENSLTCAIELGHFSVTEYLTSPSLTDRTKNTHFIDTDEGHADLLQSCLTYLSFQREDQHHKAKQDTFLQYATFQWALHAKRIESNPQYAEVIRFFLGHSETEAYLRWSKSWEERFDPNLRVNLPKTHTGLYYAALFGLPHVVKLLIDEPNAKKISGGIALVGAARDGNKDVVRILLEADVDLDDRTELGWTALHRAAYNAHYEVTRMLLDSGLQINSIDKDGWTALHIAVSEGYPDIVEVLLENKADVSSKLTKSGWSPLHLASQNGSVQIARLLLDAGAQVTQVDDSAMTALHIAACHEQYRMIRLLLYDLQKTNPVTNSTLSEWVVPETEPANSNNLNSIDDVFQALHYLVKTFPNDIAFQEALGDFYFRRKMFSDAVATYEKYLYVNSINTDKASIENLTHKPYHCVNCSRDEQMLDQFIKGYRYKCTLCRGYDLCGKCFHAASFTHSHQRGEFICFPSKDWVQPKQCS